MIDIVATLAGFIATVILRDPDWIITPTEPLISSGLVDSFSLVELALFVEDEYGIRIADTELNADTIDTLQAIEQLIKTRR
ncbi:MAG: hypothetical protein Kow0031_02800 [Anaerolineae bacterium]